MGEGRMYATSGRVHATSGWGHTTGSATAAHRRLLRWLSPEFGPLTAFGTYIQGDLFEASKVLDATN